MLRIAKLGSRYHDYRLIMLLLGSSHHVADLSAREKIGVCQTKIDEFYSVGVKKAYMD